MLPDDVRAHRAWLIGHVPVPAGGLVVDLGCGAGDDLLALARRATEAQARFEGIDRSERWIEAARAASEGSRTVEFRVHDSAGELPWEDGSVDVVYSSNLLECVVDRDAWVREVARVLRRDGLLVCGHWDWDSQLWEADDKALVRRVVHAFADWKQDWMDTQDGWMGRRLWGVLRKSGQFDGTIEARVMTNTEFAAPWYGHARARDCQSMIKRDLIDQETCDRFQDELARMAAAGRYLYAITGFAFVGRRSAHPPA